MFAQEWIESLNMVFGTETTQTAVTISLLSMVCLAILIVISAPKNYKVFDILVIVEFIASLLFTYWVWLPQFVGSVIAAIFALLGAWIITGGGSR